MLKLELPRPAAFLLVMVCSDLVEAQWLWLFLGVACQEQAPRLSPQQQEPAHDQAP